MKPLFNDKVLIEVTTDDITEINELIKRDVALPCREEKDITGHYKYYCGVCNKFLWNSDANFCGNCGQRIDKDNVKL